MLRIYLLKPGNIILNGQKARKIATSESHWVMKALADSRVVEKFDLVTKREHFIGPDGVVISGKHSPGSILKIKASDFFKIKRDSLSSITLEEPRLLNMYTRQFKNKKLVRPNNSILIFERVLSEQK